MLTHQCDGPTVRRTVASNRTTPSVPLITSRLAYGTNAAPTSTPMADAMPMITATRTTELGMPPSRRSVNAPAATVGMDTARLSVPASTIGTPNRYNSVGIRISPPATPKTPLTTAIASAITAANIQRAIPVGSRSTCSACANDSYNIQIPTTIKYTQTMTRSGRTGILSRPNTPTAAPASDAMPI